MHVLHAVYPKSIRPIHYLSLTLFFQMISSSQLSGNIFPKLNFWFKDNECGEWESDLIAFSCGYSCISLIRRESHSMVWVIAFAEQVHPSGSKNTSQQYGHMHRGPGRATWYSCCAVMNMMCVAVIIIVGMFNLNNSHQKTIFWGSYEWILCQMSNECV